MWKYLFVLLTIISILSEYDLIKRQTISGGKEEIKETSTDVVSLRNATARDQLWLCGSKGDNPNCL